jgi:hypothetical protein
MKPHVLTFHRYRCCFVSTLLTWARTSVTVANWFSLICCPISLKIKLLTSQYFSIECYMLISYSYSPALKRPSVFPLKWFAWTVCKLKPRPPFYLYLLLLTSGFHPQQIIPCCSGMLRNSFSAAIANFIALQIWTSYNKSQVASSAVPKIPTGTVFTFAPTKSFVIYVWFCGIHISRFCVHLKPSLRWSWFVSCRLRLHPPLVYNLYSKWF